MNLEQAAVVLSKAAGYDRRTIGEADVRAWHEALTDIPIGDALEAVARHYRAGTDWLMPAHIRRHAAEIDLERRRTARLAAEARAAEGEAASVRRDRTSDLGRALATMADGYAAGPGLPSRFEPDPDRDARIADGVAIARAALPPETPSERAHRLALARARREHGRPEPHRKQPPAPGAKARTANPEPVDEDVATLAARYLRDGYRPARVAELLAVDRGWCERLGRRLADLGPVGWCGRCTFDSRMRRATANGPLEPCPDCQRDPRSTQDGA